MKQYILGYYCRDESELQNLNKDSNRAILNALLEAYPSGLSAHQISKKTHEPIKTVWSQVQKDLRGSFVMDRSNKKDRPGRPAKESQSSEDEDSRSGRNRNRVVIENANSLFNPYKGKKAEKIALPPGKVLYSEEFIDTCGDLIDKKELDNVCADLVHLLEKVLLRANDSNNDQIKEIAPRTDPEFCCSQCGLNHEARDFMRAILLHLIDQVEESNDYIKLLKNNNLVTTTVYNERLEPEMTRREEVGKQLQQLQSDLGRLEIHIKKAPSTDKDSRYNDLSVDLQSLNQMNGEQLTNKLKNMNISDLQALIPKILDKISVITGNTEEKENENLYFSLREAFDTRTSITQKLLVFDMVFPRLVDLTAKLPTRYYDSMLNYIVDIFVGRIYLSANTSRHLARHIVDNNYIDKLITILAHSNSFGAAGFRSRLLRFITEDTSMGVKLNRMQIENILKAISSNDQVLESKDARKELEALLKKHGEIISSTIVKKLESRGWKISGEIET